MVSAIHEDVVFDHAGAEALARQLTRTADLLADQAAQRPGAVRRASVDFRGAHARDFTQRTTTCTSDALELAAALRRAAGGLRELSGAATREQHRREAARRWEQQQEDKGTFDKVKDNVHDFFAGEDDVPPPPAPEPAPRYVSTSCVSRSR
ncbi:MAG: type secretion protein Rhs [Frankiales bacterium]|nr:type secretion protein Rhs [Frankiales bacterium]